MPRRFNLGQCVATPGALALLAQAGIPPTQPLARHVSGDWGDLDASDKRDNEQAVKKGDRRIMSAYTYAGGRLWVITEWDRSVTTLLLPEEY